MSFPIGKSCNIGFQAMAKRRVARSTATFKLKMFLLKSYIKISRLILFFLKTQAVPGGGGGVEAGKVRFFNMDIWAEN